MRRAVRQDLDARALFLRLPVREVDAYPELIRNVTTDRDRHRSLNLKKKIVSPIHSEDGKHIAAGEAVGVRVP